MPNLKKQCGRFVSTTPCPRCFDLLAMGEHNGHGGGRPSLRPAAGPRRKAANDTVVSCAFAVLSAPNPAPPLFPVPVIGPQRNDEELDNPVPKEPIMFLKPTSSFLHAGVATITVEIPETLESLHHKVELVVVISRRGRDVPEASAMDFVRGSDGPERR
uniref:Fumarylacetoacetase-like C-terminal domain-containing protein n=1 Tax=Zea mays TaxID=4577 RepID=A0A804RGY3_MAIZE